MSETLSTPEAPQYSREQVIQVLQKFVAQGVSHPDDLPIDDPEVIEANEVLDAWSAEAERHAREDPTPGTDLEFALSRSTVYVDAGFRSPEYIEEVAGDWLDQDLQRAEEQGLTDIAAKIQAKIDELNALI